MSDKIKKYTFEQLLKLGFIRIPRIQRGYAQGRKTQKVDDIRKTFLHTLFQVIRGKQKSAELDFVYGSMNKGAFEPLDGQQRLTTLFLIHWMLGVNLKYNETDKLSVFTYASCPTSEDFSNELVLHDAHSFISESIAKDCSPSELIYKRDWFQWKWKFDPSISSMLVMIDSIYLELTYDDDWSSNLDYYRNNLSNITFNWLNLGDFDMSNELFVKMNARGKQLSEFDKVKSTLEEEIQIQQGEVDNNGRPLTTQEDESIWRSRMDGIWFDYFWHSYARDLMTQLSDISDTDRKVICLAAAKKCEEQFKKLLLRLIQLQIHSRMPDSDALKEACYKRNANDIDNVLVAYRDSLLSFRSQDSLMTTESEIMISFSDLIKQINGLLIVGEDGTVSDIFKALPYLTHINCDNANLIQSFLEDILPNDVALIFFASLQFVGHYPFSKDDEWKSNFSRWITSLRNILANENNTQRIDKRWRYENAMKAICEISSDLAAYGYENGVGASDINFVEKFFASIRDRTYVGIDNQSLKEEIDKASLVVADVAWKDVIAKAESDFYLWGQIRALIDWSGKDLEKFKSYSAKLTELLGMIRDNSTKYYLASLKLDPAVWSVSNRLYQLNNDRDNSFKRYLRDDDKELNTKAAHIKKMIDLWINQAFDLSVERFLDTVISDKNVKTPKWVECIIQEPSILDYAYHKRIYTDRGHILLAQLKTMDSHCVDPILKYLQVVGMNLNKRGQITLNDSKGTPSHCLTYASDKGTYSLCWSEEFGSYKLVNPEGELYPLSDTAAVDEFLKIYNS